MSESEVKFLGQSPFDLPIAQSVSASSLGEIVYVTLYVIAPEQGTTPVPVRCAMQWKHARELATQLTKESLTAEIHAWKGDS
jgi:hypothetical protein